MKRAKIKGLACGGCFVLALVTEAGAQFHNPKNPSGQASVNQQAIKAAQQQASVMPVAPAGNATAMIGGGLGGGDMILPDGTKQALSQYKVSLGQMQGKQVDIWGRAIHHSDESYTESKQDAVTNTLTQTTKSKSGVSLQHRMVTLDELGRPDEVLIYDGRMQFKYRGKQVYDTFGRFSEEQLYDAKGTLIRRKVQGYDPRGEKLPLRSWDYVANVPEDLKLVITREDAAAPGVASGPGATAPGTTADPAAPKKGFNLRGIFGKKAK